MGYVVSFTEYVPPERFDAEPWSEVTIEEAPTSTGPWTLLETQALNPLDTDPSKPATRNFTTELGTAPLLWYRITFVDADSDTSLPSPAIQNTGAVSTYATVSELFRVLKIREPTAAQIVAAEGRLATSTLEIDREIDRSTDDTELTAAELDLVRGVCIDRAADLWRHTESIPGILGVLDEGVPTTPGRYSWERYAQRLAPLKSMWGLA